MTIDRQPETSGTPNPLPARAPTSRKVILFAAVLAAGLTGAVATKAFSQGPGFGHGFGPGFMSMHGPMSDERIAERADRMVRHIAVEADATPEQVEKLRGVMRAAVKDILPVREKAQSVREQTRALLTQQTINRAELEKLRAEQVATADAVSKRLVQALADAAEVLTPEQRRKLNDHFPPRGAGWRPWHRG